MDLRERRELNKGMGDGLSRAFELVFTPIVVAGLGFFLDRWLGLTPLFTILFALWGIAATTFLAWIRYDREMKVEEDRRAEHLRTAGPRPGRRRRGLAFDRPLAEAVATDA